MQHIIKKQIIQLRLNNRQDAFRIQNRMSEHYRHDLLPVMENLFDESITEEETLHINKLEVDLGLLTAKDFDRQTWDDEILAPLVDQLRSTLSKLAADTKKTDARLTAIAIGKQWLFYMQRGYLPWNALKTDADWKQKVLEALSADFAVVSELRKLIRSDENAVSRITEQHGESFLITLVEILTARKQQHLSELLDELEILYRALPKAADQIESGQNVEIRNIFWKHILRVSAAGQVTGEEIVFVQRIVKRCFGRLISLLDLPEDLRAKLHLLEPAIREAERKAMAFGTEADISSEITEEIKVRRNGHAEQEEEKPQPDEEGIFVRQAGAVLLHPFLGTFFSRLKLTKAGAYRNIEAQQKALCLMHYLCTGAAEAEEHELVIPKVLCGYPLKKPVKKQIRFRREEKEEAEHLLEEVIRQWEKLKNTSPAGLRESFLQRGGKLFTKKDLWHLRVETDTIDILLDHLPWNLSIIKLPWMKDIIRVEWR